MYNNPLHELNILVRWHENPPNREDTNEQSKLKYNRFEESLDTVVINWQLETTT